MPLRRPAAPSPVVRGRALFAAVVIGAAGVAIGQALLPGAQAHPDAGSMAAVGTNSHSIAVPPAHHSQDASAEARQLAASRQITGRQGVDTPAGRATAGATFAAPTTGTVVATFGGQYGAFHYGIDIRNAKDTPITAVADGVIIEAGPSDGFGLWVKEQLADGTTLVYARMDTYSVQLGQHVTAGEQIAKMGDRGFGSQYTLHFEVWNPSGTKIDPETWLNQRGVTV